MNCAFIYSHTRDRNAHFVTAGNRQPTAIGIAVVEHAGSYLVGMRPEGVPLAGYAEFPGGKCLPNESPVACALRECHEETGLAVASVRLLVEQVHEYPHGVLHLHFWLCQPAAPEQVPSHCGRYVWVSTADLPAHRFPEANGCVLEILASPSRQC